MTEKNPEAIQSYILDGRGRSTTIDQTGLVHWTKDQGTLWVHIDINDAESRSWIENNSGLEPSIADALLAGETRPRSHATEGGLLVVLRGVNTNPGNDPEDMVSIRLWIERDRIISTRRRRLLAVSDIRDTLKQGNGPKSAGGFLAVLTGRLADRIGNYVDSIEDRVGDAEDQMATQDQTEFRQSIANLRRQIASVRRFLSPQRDALDRLYRNPGRWLNDLEAQELREEADRITRYLEDLELARERTMVLREEFLGQLAQEQNSRMYVLSVVAAIFLPLTFITGLLGMNVGGLPGLDHPRGFIVSVIAMVVAAVVLLAYFRSKRWL